jgi:hypothetical protein
MWIAALILCASAAHGVAQTSNCLTGNVQGIGSVVVNAPEVTVSAWVNLASYPSSNSPYNQVIGFENGLGSGTLDKDLYVGNDGKLYFYVFDGAGKVTTPSAALPIGTRHHVVGIADGTNAHTYIDGVLVGSVAVGPTYAGYSVPNVFVGSGAPGFALNATIDTVCVYNRALSASEVAQLYQLGIGASPPPPPPPPPPAATTFLTAVPAVCDGSTADTALIQSAINAANAAGGGWLMIPQDCPTAGPLTTYANVRTWGVVLWSHGNRPTVTAVSPAFGTTAGGTSVTISGTNFAGFTAVNFGSVAATGCSGSSTTLTCTSGAGSAGLVNATVTTPGGTSATGSADQFTYIGVPTVASVSPNTGSTAGGTSVTITGTNLLGSTIVNFGASNPASFVVTNNTTIAVASSPAGSAATINVTVTTPQGTSATGTPDQFTYISGGCTPFAYTGASLYQSYALTDSGWTNGLTAFATDQIASPDCANSGATIVEDMSGGGGHQVYNNPINVATSTLTYQYTSWVRSVMGTRNAYIAVDGGGFNGNSAYVGVNLSNCTSAIPAATAGAFTAASASITSVAINGSTWCETVLTFTGATGTGIALQFALLEGTTIVYTGDGTSTIGIWGVDFRGVPTTAVAANDFLNSLGVNTHIAQSIDTVSPVSTALTYLGVRQVRDGGSAAPGIVAEYLSIHAATGVLFDLLPSPAGDLTDSISVWEQVAAAGALLAAEGPNEPNNFPFTYMGVQCNISTTFLPCAKFQADMYVAVHADTNLAGIKVFGLTEPGAEPDNVGLQWLTIPSGSGLTMPDGTVYADFANAHNYLQANGQTIPVDNNEWFASDAETLTGAWDSLYGENGNITWNKFFPGYPRATLPSLPKISTETGWYTTTAGGGTNPITEDQQGKMLTNMYLSSFKRGWAYTFVYMLRDDASQGSWGFFHTDYTAKLSGTYLHNMTTILADTSSAFTPGQVNYTIASEPADVHDVLLQKSNGHFMLAVWGEQVAGSSNLTIPIALGATYGIVNVYDPILGASPQQTLTNVSSVTLTVNDHVLIVELIP